VSSLPSISYHRSLPADREAAAHLLSFFPAVPLTVDTYLSRRTLIQDRLWPTVPLLPGVHKLVHHLHAHRIPIAIATGSYRHQYDLKRQNLGDVFDCFEGRVVCADDHLGDDRERVRPKPWPDVFLYAAREKLGRPVGAGADEECTEGEREERRRGLIFEDALLGMQAGKRAGMSGKHYSIYIIHSQVSPVVWVPDANILDVTYSGVEKPDQTLKSMEDFVPERWGLPPYNS
jgi:pseudouridine-5'-monophosphatase